MASGLDFEKVFVAPGVGNPAKGMVNIASGMMTHLGVVQQYSGGVALIGDSTSSSGEFFTYPNLLVVDDPVASGYLWPSGGDSVVFGRGSGGSRVYPQPAAQASGVVLIGGNARWF